MEERKLHVSVVYSPKQQLDLREIRVRESICGAQASIHRGPSNIPPRPKPGNHVATRGEDECHGAPFTLRMTAARRNPRWSNLGMQYLMYFFGLAALIVVLAVVFRTGGDKQDRE
jgi:hypothetical protein